MLRDYTKQTPCEPRKSNRELIGSAVYRERERSEQGIEVATQAPGLRFKDNQTRNTERFAKVFHGGKVTKRLVSMQVFVKRDAGLQRNIADIARKLARAQELGDTYKIAKLRSLLDRQLDTRTALIDNRGGKL